jgi:ABC-type phosphate transport system substrate-binding protein
MNTTIVKSLAAAVALACVGSAHALDISQFNEADVANQVTLRIGGASAQDNGLERLMQLKASGGAEICANGTLDIYRTADNQNRLFFCTGGANSGAVGKRLAIFKRSNGGSGTGIATVVRKNAVLLDDGTNVAPNFLNPAALSGAGTSVVGVGNFANYVDHTGFPNNATVAAPLGASDVGISDVEPNKFFSIFNPDITSAEASAIAPTTFAISAVIFGLPVTQGIYERLQAVEFPAANPCNPNNAGYAAVANSQGCMPSLTQAQIQAILTGNYFDWSQIASNHTAGLDVSTATTPSYGALVDTGIYIERRVLSSGTQASFEIHLLGQRCIAGSPLFLRQADDPAHVFENSSGGTIPGRMNAHDAAGRGAIATLTTEIVPGASDKFRFIKINGNAPTVENVVKSKYDFVMESTLQYRNSAINTLPALGGLQKAVADAIKNNIGNFNVVNDLDTKFVHTFGTAGLAGSAVSQGANAAIPPFTATGAATPNDVLFRPILLKTRAASGTLNACLPYLEVLNSQGNP